MKCQSCDNQATVHLTEISGGVKKELHLCQECAVKQGVSAAKYQESLSAMLAGIANVLSKAEKGPEIQCPHCGMKLSEFRAQGRLGCAEDYAVFGRELMPLIEGIHKSRHHKAKRPRRATSVLGRDSEIEMLQAELKVAIDREEYERAAVIRDRLNSLGGRMGDRHEPR
jgi:protein arginine kinase activator